MRSPKNLRRTAAAAAALASLALVPGAALAAEEMRTGGPPAQYVEYLNMKEMQAMHMMDTGDKGFVTKDEFVRFHDELFDRMDKDHDGKVTSTEWMGGHKPSKGDR